MWQQYESCHYLLPDSHVKIEKAKIASFDLDSTLIYSNKGEKYASSTDGWIFAWENVVELLTQYHEDGWTIVIFSNRRGSPWGIKAIENRILKIRDIIKVPFYTFFAVRKDNYRKPEIGMFNLFIHLLGITQIEDGFYCGDAAGETSTFKWNTWQDSDLNFAKNTQLRFVEPQNVFKNFEVPTISPETRLIITIGQIGSGWDENMQYVGNKIQLNDDTIMVVIDDSYINNFDFSTNEENGMKYVYYVLGTHPTEQSRYNVMLFFGIYNPEYHVYFRPSYNGMNDSQYTKTLKLPNNYVRCS